jgi:hypothetical protein
VKRSADAIRFVKIAATVFLLNGLACGSRHGGADVSVRVANNAPTRAETASDQNLPRLSRDCEYWRATERTPGPLACRRPVARGVWVTCDRWPDGSDLRHFGQDAIRLCGATTDHEKALAVYRWVRRWMVFPTGGNNAPTEKLVSRHRKNGFVDQGLKQLNVYGVHWCDGQVRIFETVWRALGYRAEKVVCGGHTIVGCHFKDHDGVARWHAMDVSHSGLLFDRSYRRLLSLDELATVYYGGHYQWVFCPHNDWDDHRMELSLRVGEKIERIWGNRGKPYQDNVSRRDRKVPEWERGPYPLEHGDGRWTYTPDLAGEDWMQALAEPPANMTRGGLRPADVGRSATAVWDFRTPYIIADAKVTLRLKRRSADDRIRLHLSIDDGETWNPLWDCPANVVGDKVISVPIGARYTVTGSAEPPPSLNSPFGRYAYRLKLELFAASDVRDCRVHGICFETVVQQNYFALPQLQPGKNLITVRGHLPAGEALRVTYLWDDTLGGRRTNVTVVEKTPHTYEILAAGRNWQDCICKSIVIEGIRATGGGNRMLVKEEPSLVPPMPPMRPVEETARAWYQPQRNELGSIEQVIAGLRKGTEPKRWLGAAMMHADARAFEEAATIVAKTANSDLKHRAMVALYVMDRDKARPILFEVASDKARSKWDTSKDPVGEAPWIAGTAVIGLMAADAGWNEFLPLMIRALKNPTAWPGWGPRYTLIRIIGRLGRGDRKAAAAIRAVLTDQFQREDDDGRAVAALAAGQIGDVALLPALRQHANSAYAPLAQNAALSMSVLGDKPVAGKARAWLNAAADENFRGAGAEILGNLRDRESLAILREALAIEPFPWVREKMSLAIHTIESLRDSPSADEPKR